MTHNYYDEDAERVRKVGIDLNQKWNFVARRLDNPLGSKVQQQMIQVWHDEAVNRYREAGFIVEVDITPALAGISPPTIAVVGKTEDKPFDHDKKAWEVRRSRSQGGR